MNSFYLQQEKSTELNHFPHIIELATKKITTVHLNSLKEEATKTFRLYYVVEGKHEWKVNNQSYLLFPGDIAVVLPGQMFGGKQDFLDIGTISWIDMHIDGPDSQGKMQLGKWSSLSETETNTIGKILLLNNTAVLSRQKEAGDILQSIYKELTTQEIGFTSCVNHLLDDLFILIARQLSKQGNARRDFPQTFNKLEEVLRGNLSHQWTVEEMAALVGLGTTAFTEKVKRFTGFSPLHYLINIRISEAIRLLKKENVNLTDIALDVGFYSSQHFSTTFKKLTGYTPSQFRKNNLSTQ
jgi:AraC-like DNA-binding protein